MVQLNRNFKSLKREYIFPVIEKKLAEIQEKNPQLNIVNLGVGDIILPLVPTVAEAICRAAQEMVTPTGVRGYGPSEGYLFLREAISQRYGSCQIAPDEIFISEGTNADAANLLDLFNPRAKIGIPDPTYPVYLDAAILDGRLQHVTLLPCNAATGYLPHPPPEHLDVAYLCSPNNPTGVAMNFEQMKAWVKYAHQEKAILIIDNAYEAFITSPEMPRSIYEIEGAKEVAIELRSFSKSAGFTGLRCAYAVVPKAIQRGQANQLWLKRQSIKTNGVSYPIQKGAEASLSPKGISETKTQIAHYLEQGKILRDGLHNYGYTTAGGYDAPYIWWKIPEEKTSWQFFDEILHKCHLITIPGKGFGHFGEGYMRLSTFTSSAKLAIERLCALKS